MNDKKGLFIVFEGIDGSGKGTQLSELIKHLDGLNKYIDIIKTHEPWRSYEIKRKLEEDKEAYSDGITMAKLYVEDRINHSLEIKAKLNERYFVLCDRYKMSTCAYQWTQGVDLEELFKMHEDDRILIPDLTLFIDVNAEIAQERREKRGTKYEKFEYVKFQSELRRNYLSLIERQDCSDIFGEVCMINGRGSVEEVSDRVRNAFMVVYSKWIDGKS